MLQPDVLEHFEKNSEGLYEIYDMFSFDKLFRWTRDDTGLRLVYKGTIVHTR